MAKFSPYRIIPARFKKTTALYNLSVIAVSLIITAAVFYLILLPGSIFLSFIVSEKLDAGMAGMSVLLLFISIAVIAGMAVLAVLLFLNMKRTKTLRAGLAEYRTAGDGDMAAAELLFREYVSSLGIDLSFQDIEAELSSLPGKYAAPEGAIILAYCGGELCGCGALKKIEPGICEMKRLYVRDRFKSLGIGRGMAVKLMEKAAEMGYDKIRLDTLSSMHAAHSLYKSLGFYEIPPYVYNPIEDAVFMEKKISKEIT